MSTKQDAAFDKADGSYDTIVIGGGQAGLAAGYFLAQQGADFLILDAYPRSGDAWRARWDSLRLFTPSQFNGLPGLPFPAPQGYLPGKDEVADYLEGYAGKFKLPVRHGVRVERLSRDGQGYQIKAGASNLTARNVIVATGPFQVPYKPPFASELDPAILQLHSSAYNSPKDIPAQSVLVVGAGNSGAEIALELVRAGKQVWLAGRDVGRIPANMPVGKVLGKIKGGRPIWWFMSNVLNVNTPIGRKIKAGELHHGTPLGRTTRQEIASAGVALVTRVSGAMSGKPQLEDGRTLPAQAVIWATGFRPDYRWIDLPVFDEHGSPRHWRGGVQDMPGLYFLGLPFQTALNSSLLGGVGADAAYIAGQIPYRKAASGQSAVTGLAPEGQTR